MSEFIDLTGNKYGNLTVIKRADDHVQSGGTKITQWLCVCECGNMTIVPSVRLRSGKTKSCGCYRKKFRKKDSKQKKINLIKSKNKKLKKEKPKKLNSNKTDLSKMKFEHLTVIRKLEKHEREIEKNIWLCRCDCGKEIQVSTDKLKNNKNCSCGCIPQKRNCKPRKHGLTKSRIANIYGLMVARCTNPNNPAYADYGGRGINVCVEWLGEHGLEKFNEWSVSHGYSPELEIDRIDNNKGYSPDNCRWTTKKIQCRNRRSNVYITYKGRTQSLADWCDELGLEYNMIYLRYRRGMETERMFTQPKRVI